MVNGLFTNRQIFVGNYSSGSLLEIIVIPNLIIKSLEKMQLWAISSRNSPQAYRIQLQPLNFCWGKYCQLFPKGICSPPKFVCQILSCPLQISFLRFPQQEGTRDIYLVSVLHDKFQNVLQSMEKENLSVCNPFLIQPQLLREREGRKTFCFNRKTINFKHKQRNQFRNHTLMSSSENSNSSHRQPKHKDVNWLRYNILVGIYENWIRLYPYIQHLLRKFPQLNQAISQTMSEFDFLRRVKPNPQQSKPNYQKEAIRRFIQTIRERRLQILQKITQLSESNIDGEMVKLVNKMTHQLLSTLSIQNSKWNKFRIQKHNRLIHDAINKLNQSQFAVNSSFILSSLKERLEFIQKIQESYIETIKFDPKFHQKLTSLKQPFETGIFAGSKITNLEEKLELVWKQLKNERFNIIKSKKGQLKNNNFIQRYIIVDVNSSESLVIKYKNKKNEYFNDSYIKKLIKPKKKQSRSKSHSKQSKQHEEDEELPFSAIQIEQISNQSRKSSTSDKDQCAKELQKQDLDKLDSFLKKTKQKIHKDSQGSAFKTRMNKKESIPRPSISYLETPKMLRDLNRKSTSVQMLNGDRKEPGSRTTTKQIRPSIQNLVEDVKEDHLNRFKSHKKIGTIKHLKAGNSKIRITKEHTSLFKTGDTNIKFLDSQSKIDKSQTKREFFINRKGNLLRKGVFRRPPVQRQTNFEDILSMESTDFVHKRNEIVAYLTMIKQKGLLNQQKYTDVKQKLQKLILKTSASCRAANQEYAKKMYEKSIQLDYFELPPSSPSRSFQRRDNFLREMAEFIHKDQQGKMKYKEEMKAQEPGFHHRLSQIQAGNQHYVFNSVEVGDLHEQIKRMLQFQQENHSITMANYLRNVCNKLEQKEVQ